MFNLIPVSLLIGALGGILYIVSNHLSEFNNEEEKKEVFGFNLKARFIEYINQLPLDNIKSQSLSVTQKLLHRFRLTLLKTDNHLMRLIGKISQRDKISNEKSNGNGNDSSPDFWENLAKPEKQISPPAVETEVKVNFAVENEAAKKYFDIQPAKISSKIYESKPVKIYSEMPEVKRPKKSLKNKKNSK